jgi:hypothetical protein
MREMKLKDIIAIAGAGYPEVIRSFQDEGINQTDLGVFVSQTLKHTFLTKWPFKTIKEGNEVQMRRALFALRIETEHLNLIVKSMEKTMRRRKMPLDGALS